MSGGRQSSESSKRMRTTPPSPISASVGTQPSLVGGLGYTLGGPSSHLSTSRTSSTAAVSRYVDDDVNFLRDLREINRVEREQIDRDTPVDARIHSTISNGSHSPDKPTSSMEQMSDDLKRVENLLQSIVSMVDECKSAVKSLRQQCQLTTLRSVDSQADINQRAVAEAVSEVKKQAVTELRKAVAESELKASQLIAAERARLDTVVAEARKQAVEEILLSIRAPQESTEACWNCGRKATETCSGCNTARYCGSFCQHKDWETHHKICGSAGTARPQTRNSQNGRSPTSAAVQLEPPKQETSGEGTVADTSRSDGERSSKSSPHIQLSAEPTKRETPSETE